MSNRMFKKPKFFVNKESHSKRGDDDKAFTGGQRRRRIGLTPTDIRCLTVFDSVARFVAAGFSFFSSGSKLKSFWGGFISLATLSYSFSLRLLSGGVGVALPELF